jgi:glycosyltransferase involved in cell wall biosynthesis
MTVPDCVKSVNRVNIPFENLPLSLDDGLRWIPSLYTNIIDSVEMNDIDVIFHSAPLFLPFACTIPVRKRIDTPYIVDLRDPWTIYPNSSNSFLSSIYNFASELIEPRVFEYSDKIIMNNASMYREYSKKYPEYKEKMATIYNGFDEEDLSQINVESSRSDVFRIIYPGKFRQDMDTFFRTFKNFTENGYNISFVHFGSQNTEEFSNVKEQVRKLGIDEFVDFRGPTTKKTVLREIAKSHLGLAATRPNDPTHIPAKIFDYIACNTPILCLDELKGATRPLLKPFDNAYTIERDDITGIQVAISDVYQSRPSTISNPEQRMRYSRRSQTKELVKEIQNIV